MKIFKLPDLGEGLPEAEIREWYVNVGDEVKVDQPLIAVETAKALVDVPAPYSGIIEKRFGEPGDTIKTGKPLIGFKGEDDSTETADTTSGTVVGNIEVSDQVLDESATGVNTKVSAQSPIKASPAVRAMARRLNIHLKDVSSPGPRITQADLRAYQQQQEAAHKTSKLTPGMQSLPAARRAMVLSMQQSQPVISTTLCDDADLAAWEPKQDTTFRICRAIISACLQEPILNSHLDAKTMSFQQHDDIHLGLAIDTRHGLYVPVIKNIKQLSQTELRAKVEHFKQQASTKSIAQADLHGATLTLSNFGAIAGRYAAPVIVPPMVAIVGVGRGRDQVVAVDGDIKIHRCLPLSLSVDHRLVTGGEALRFLRAMMDDLAKPQ